VDVRTDAGPDEHIIVQKGLADTNFPFGFFLSCLPLNFLHGAAPLFLQMFSFFVDEDND